MREKQTQQIRRTAIEQLNERPRSPSGIACRVNRNFRKDALLDGDEDRLVDADDVQTVFEELVERDEVVRLDDPDGWYQLADWHTRPLRVTSVSHHVTSIEGVDQVAKVWLNEAVRAARFEHDLNEPELQQMSATGERTGYLISTRDLSVLDQFRKTLRRLAESVQDSNPEKAAIYENLEAATDLEDQFDASEREVMLRG